MEWGEAIRLTRVLLGDTSAHITAAINGWRMPVSAEYLALKVLVDNDVTSKTEKRGRLAKLLDPFAPPPKRFGRASMSIAEWEALRALNTD